MLAKLGVTLIIASIGFSFYDLLSVSGEVNVSMDGNLTSNIQNNDNTAGNILKILAFIVGVFLIWFDLFRNSKNPKTIARILLTGMNGTTSNFPNNVLYNSDKSKVKEIEKLEISEDYSLEKNISKFNANIESNLFNRLLDDTTHYYIGGLARVPMLIAYGFCFRASSSEPIYFDFDHKNNRKPFLLDEENKNISIIKTGENIEPNDNGDIGISVSFSADILKEHLPEYIQEHCLYIKPDIDLDRNLIKSQENLNSIVDDIRKIVDDFSKKQDVKKIHFFLATQSSFALELGRRYQEGIHKNWVVHNFDGSKGEYTWALELTKHYVSLI
jgi:hypothetical protein